jgi:hypothetical protein
MATRGRSKLRRSKSIPRENSNSRDLDSSVNPTSIIGENKEDDNLEETFFFFGGGNNLIMFAKTAYN